jgi:signal transduction histidine kinase
LQVAPGVRFRGERQDLEEMVGNLIDNACKWGKRRVHVSVEAVPHADRPLLHIRIDDDGPGLPAEVRDTMVKRGQRLDETKPGSGLGLAIVADLAVLYRGVLRMAQSPLGGLRAMLDLPGDGA